MGQEEFVHQRKVSELLTMVNQDETFQQQGVVHVDVNLNHACAVVLDGLKVQPQQPDTASPTQVPSLATL